MRSGPHGAPVFTSESCGRGTDNPRAAETGCKDLWARCLPTAGKLENKAQFKIVKAAMVRQLPRMRCVTGTVCFGGEDGEITGEMWKL